MLWLKRNANSDSSLNFRLFDLCKNDRMSKGDIRLSYFTWSSVRVGRPVYGKPGGGTHTANSLKNEAIGALWKNMHTLYM